MTVLQEDDVFELMKDVVDPELGINVVDLGLVYAVTVDEGNIATIDMTLTSAACPLTDVIEDQTRAALDGHVSDFKLNWVWMCASSLASSTPSRSSVRSVVNPPAAAASRP